MKHYTRFLHMKKMFLLLAVFFTASGTLLAQTDVTATYLTNPGFDVTCNYLTADDSTNLGSANAGANIKEVTGWTKGDIGDNSAAASYEYGYKGTLNVSGTGGKIPAAGPNAETGTGHGALGISAAWSGTVTYFQNVTLPVGKYTIEYAAYNSGPNAADNSRVGWVPAVGTAVLSTKTSFALNTWVTDKVSFTVTAETAGKIQVGINAPGANSASVGRIFFDHVKITFSDIKSELLVLKDSASAMVANPQPVETTSTAYTDLATAVTAAQAVYDNAGATVTEIVDQETALKAAIAKVHSHILIYSRVVAWSSVPYIATSIIVNPSFETGNTSGWTNVGGFVGQSNNTFPYKAGTYYVERWKSTGNWTGLKLSQVIKDVPNGNYLLTVAALNSPTTTGGAFVYANLDSVEIFLSNDYSLVVEVVDNKLEIGYQVINGGNYVGVDNFRLTYLGEETAYFVMSPDNLVFDANNLVKTFIVKGDNLTQDATLVAPAGITLDKTSLTVAEVVAGDTITATYSYAAAINNEIITVTSGTTLYTINVIGSYDKACYTPLFTNTPNLVPNPYLNSIAGFGGWGIKSVVFGSEAYCGAAALKFNATTNTYPNGAALDISMAWKPNTTYRFRAMVKAVDGTFAFYTKGTSPDLTFMVAQSNDEWVLIDETFTTGATTTNNFITFNNVDGGATGKVAYIDNYELYEVPNPTGALAHLYTFDDGTAKDEVGNADGTLVGAAKFNNNALNTQTAGSYMSFPGDSIKISTFEAATIETWFTSVSGGNTGNTMLSYFGNTTGNYGTNYLFTTVSNGGNARVALSAGNTTAPWTTETGTNGTKQDDGKLHQIVTVVDSTTLSMYLDGKFVSKVNLPVGRRLENVGDSLVYLAMGGYVTDPKWRGMIHKHAIYKKALHADEVIATFMQGAESESILTASVEKIALDNNVTSSVFVVNAVNMQNDITITAPAGFTVTPATLPATAMNAEVVVTFTGTETAEGNITLTSGETVTSVPVKGIFSDCYTKLFADLDNLIVDPFMSDMADFGGWGDKSIIDVFDAPTDVYCGATSGKVSLRGSIDAKFTTPLVPNTTYVVKAIVKTTVGAEFQIGVWGWNGSAADLNNKFKTEGEWQAVEFEFTTGETLGSTSGMFFNNWECALMDSVGTAGFIDNWELYVAPANTVTISYKNQNNKALKADRVETVAAKTGWYYKLTEEDKGRLTVNDVKYVYDNENSVDSVLVTRGNVHITVFFKVDVTEVPSVIGDNESKVFVRDNRLVVDMNVSNASDVNVTIFNAQGVQVASEHRMFNAGLSREEMPFDYASGIYFVRITAEGKSVTHKVLK